MIRLLFALLLPIFIFNQSKAIEPCATEMPEEMRTWLKTHLQQRDLNQYKTSQYPLMYIPVKVHIVGDDNGRGYYGLNDLYEDFCILNQQYEKANLHFFIYEDINYIDNSDLYIHSNSWNIGFAIQNQKDNDAINIFYVQDPAGACGYFSPGADFIAINKSCGGPGNTTVAHEIGHFLSLPHTFSGWEGNNTPALSQQEKVDGSNCRTAGDGFCDTPPDYLAYRWPCPFTGILTDPNGVQISPDESLYMSYAFDNCSSRFSDEQIDAMRAYINNQRDYLKNHNVGPFPIVASTSLTGPAVNSNGNPYNYTVLRWKHAEGATHYWVNANQFTNPSGININQITTDTFLIVQLEPSSQYYWRVRPYSAGYTCTGSTNLSVFRTTSSPTAIFPTVSSLDVSCPGATNGSASISATGGQSPYQFLWSNGQVGPTVSNLGPGNYIVTIIDALNDTMYFPVDIAEPGDIKGSIQEFDNSQFYLNISGGSAPFGVVWSDGQTGQVVSLTGGSYQLTVTDANNCSQVLSIDVIGTAVNLSQINCFGSNNGSISVVSSNGTPPYTYNWSNGENSSTIDSLAPGTYTLEILDSNNNSRNLSFDINEPTQLNVSITNIDGTNVAANVSGGIAPYTYMWSDGTISEQLNIVFDGDYYVDVTDANGCTIRKNFQFTVDINSIADQQSSEEIKIYPNPIRNQSLNLEFNSINALNANVKVLNYVGKVLSMNEFSIQHGDNRLSIPTNGLSAGVYFIDVEMNDLSINRRFVILD